MMLHVGNQFSLVDLLSRETGENVCVSFPLEQSVACGRRLPSSNVRSPRLACAIKF